MRYPDFLSENDCIGFVAPSFGCATEPYKTGFGRALDNFKSLGFNANLGPNCYEDKGIGISNTPEKCGKELVDMYTTKDNKALISCGGGELMCEVLNHVDFEKIKNATPKWYLGYSDNTNFTYLQTTAMDTAAVYGPCAAAFGMQPWHKALCDTFDILTGNGFEKSSEGYLKKSVSGYSMWEKESLKTPDNPTPAYNLTELKHLRAWKGSEEVTGEKLAMSGRLVGGCMDCLVNLLGTSFDKTEKFVSQYKEDGIIWFLESCDLNVFSIRRAMWQMDNAGWFKNVRGFLIGRPLCFGQEMMGLDQYKAVVDIVGKYNVPIIMDCDFGHLPPAMPIVSGSYAVISSESNDIEIEYQFR